jgi:hypothetical protein
MIALAAIFESPYWSKRQISKNNPDIMTEILNIFIIYEENEWRLQNPLPAAKFIVPDWGDKDKVDSGIGLSWRPARLHRLAGWYDNPMQKSTMSPQSGTMNLATEFHGSIAMYSCHSVPRTI